MKLKHTILLTFFLAFSLNSFSFKIINDVATTAGGYDIPIKIQIPDGNKGPYPVVFVVHGGGWNGGDESKVPPAGISGDANYLCDYLGVVYVGLAYRCKGNRGTFELAVEDLEASVKWFMERADNYKADLNRIGFSGGSAGTTLSSVMAQKYKNCKAYVGTEGMYNVLDQDTLLSAFPSSKGKSEYGLTELEQRKAASAYYNLRNNPKPAPVLLFHGKDDFLCNYTQSQKYAEKIKESGGMSKVVLYDGINHTCLSPSYPKAFRNSVLEIAKHYQKCFKLEQKDLVSLEKLLDQRIKGYYSYENIDSDKLIGNWKSKRWGTYLLEEDGKGKYINKRGKEKDLVYHNEGAFFTVKKQEDSSILKFYLRKKDNVIYELVTAEGRLKSRRKDFIKQK